MKRLRSKIIKRIFGIVLIMGCSGVLFNGYVGMGESVHAQVITNGGDSTIAGAQVTDTMSIWQILNMVLKIIYLLLWPLLVVAGLALDNTLVYASIFHLDAPLWKFWNMMKNFANFALGFMVLFAIIKSILTNSGEGSVKDEKSPLGIIKTTLIAGILIQASRFLVAALVDVSTIATYAVGGLPLSVLKNTAIGDQKILSVNSSLDLNKFNISAAGGKEFRVWYSTKHPGIGGDKIVNMSPCRVERSYVIGRQYGDPNYKNTAKFVGTAYEGLEVCVLFGNQLVMWPEEKFFVDLSNAKGYSTGYSTATEAQYTQAMDALLNITGWDTRDFVTGNLVYLASGTKVFATGNAFFSGTDSLTISSLIQKSKGFVGPLVTIYSSLLNFAQLTDANVTSASGTSGIFIIKALVAIALFFPLIALALVLILRIGMLWLYIVASPFIILKASFKNFIPIKELDDYLSVKAVMGIIFAPVVTVAALSISLIFLTALVNGFSNDSGSAIDQALGIEKTAAIQTGNDAMNFGGITSFEFSKLPWGEAMDRFSWLMVNFFAIGLMRMIVFAAIKANKIGEGVGKKVQDFGANIFKTLPVLPIGEGGKRVGITGAYNVLNAAPERWMDNQKYEQQQIAETWLNGPKGAGTGTTFTADNALKIATNLGSGSEAIKALETAGINATPETLINYSTQNNISIMSKAIDGLKTQKEKDMATAGAAPMFGNNINRRKDEIIRVAKEKVDALLTSAKTEADVRTIVKNHKTELDEYFAITTKYTTPVIDNTTFDITNINGVPDVVKTPATTTPTK